MGRLKLLNIWAVVDDDQMTVSRRKDQDSSKGSLGKNSGGIVVEAIHFVYVTGYGRKLDNLRPHRGGRKGGHQRGFNSGVHKTYAVQVTAIQMMIARTVTK